MRCAIHGNQHCTPFCTGLIREAPPRTDTPPAARGADAPLTGLQGAAAHLAPVVDVSAGLAPAIAIALAAGACDPAMLYEARARIRAARVELNDLRHALSEIEAGLVDAERALTDEGNGTTAHPTPATVDTATSPAAK